MVHVLISLFIWFHNIAYSALSSLVVRAEGGVHPKQRIINYGQFFLDHIESGNTVLDVGAGFGYVAVTVAQKAKKVVGIDLNEQSIAKAKKNDLPTNVSFLVGDATTYPFAEQFDVIILSNTLEHIANRVELLRKLSVRTKTFLIRVPLLTRDWLAVYKKEKGYEYRLDPTHYIEYTEEIFQEEMHRAGLILKSMHTKFGELYAVAMVSSASV